LSLKTKVGGLSVVWPQNHWDGFSLVWVSKPMAAVCEWFGLKTTRTVFAGLTSKPVVTVSSGLASKPIAMVFSSLTSKLVATVSSSLSSKLVVTVSPSSTSKPAVDFLVEPQNQGGRGFLNLGLKTDRYGLVICASKSPRQFLGLGFKTKQPSVSRLRHKTDRVMTVWDTHRDLAACFTWKQVWLGFPSLARRLAEARQRVVHVTPSRMLRWRQVEDGRVDATGYVGPCYTTFVVFNILDHWGIVVI
jgi:hypothetical protein